MGYTVFKALASYGEGLLGRPPEFEMILGQMEVISTMHGGYRDTPEWISSDTMNQIYHYLLDGMHSLLFHLKIHLLLIQNPRGRQLQMQLPAP